MYIYIYSIIMYNILSYFIYLYIIYVYYIPYRLYSTNHSKSSLCVEPGSDTYASTSEGYQGGSFESDRRRRVTLHPDVISDIWIFLGIIRMIRMG